MNSTSSQLSSTEYQRRRMRHLQQIPSTGMMKGLSNQDDYSFQQQYGRVNHSRDSSMDDCTNFCDVKGPMSPTAWMCEVTGKKVSQLCRPFMSGNSNVQIGKEDLSIKRSGRHDNSDTSVSSWRERAAKSFLSAHNSEDDDDNDDTDSFKLKPGASPYSKSINHNDNLKNQSMSPIIRPNDPDSANDEPRIIAPNVDKISPISVVEVRLQSIGECVAILCSVDVLKMRSVFFYEVIYQLANFLSI